MSKPREFEEELYDYCEGAVIGTGASDVGFFKDGARWAHAKNKSSADKLAEALDKINDDCAQPGYKYNQVEFDMVQIARQALKEYRGEK